jgi:uncharacterized protein
MRKLSFLLIFLILSLFAYAKDLPQPSGWVNDFSGVISQEYKEKITSLIEELEQKTSSEIAVVTVNSIAPYDEKEYARLLFDNWKPGKKGKDNGVLVLLAVKERRWRIETGYGVEGILPDSVCGEIGRNYMVPYFKEGNYGEGLYQGVIRIAQVIAQNANVSLKTLEGVSVLSNNNAVQIPYSLSLILFFVIVGLIILGSIFADYSQRKSGYYSGGWGYGGGSWGGGGGFGGGGFGGGGGGGGGAGGGF